MEKKYFYLRFRASDLIFFFGAMLVLSGPSSANSIFGLSGTIIILPLLFLMISAYFSVSCLNKKKERLAFSDFLKGVLLLFIASIFSFDLALIGEDEWSRDKAAGVLLTFWFVLYGIFAVTYALVFSTVKARDIIRGQITQP